MDKDDSLHFPAFDASPGENYRKWRQNLFSYAATKTDESGSSLADTLRGVDMGGPAAGAPLIPPGAPGQKMSRLRDGRAKSAYALIYKHVSDGDLRTILFTNHFQNGHDAIQYLDTVYDTPITRSELREMDKLWTELSIAQDVGIQQDSVSRFAKLLQRVNSERPAANRYSLTEMCEKLLEAIADASRHFNEGAMREYDAAVGARQFEYPAGHPLFPGQRNFGACVHYYDSQWKQAVKSKILTVTARLRIVAPSHGAVFQAPALPTTVEEARRSPFWPMVKDALEDEIRGKFIDNQAWDVVPRTAGMHVIRSKWVLKWTLNEDGSIRGVKARLVACGYGQIEGREFTDVYARTLAAPSFRLFCSIVALENLETDHIDAYKAFTQSDVDCVIFVEMPFGFVRAGHVLKLRKALEGIRQGAHLWMEHNKAVLLKLGFRQSLVEASLYVHGELNIIIAVFADDIAAAYATEALAEYTAIKEQYVSHIRVRSAEIVPLATFTGVNITRDRQRGTLTISQTSYIDQLAERYKGRFQRHNTPGPTSQAGRREFDKQEPGKSGDPTCVDRVAYLRLIGSLIWPASMTRPDIAYHVSILASFNVCPLQSHMDYALNVLGYLVHTRELGITYGGPLKVPMGLDQPPPGFVESGGLHTFHDSSWGTSAKPYGGFVVMRANGVILASSRALKIVPDSTAEAETAVASKAAKETTAMRMICEDLKRTVMGPTVLLGDNKACYDIIVKTGLTARTRYFERATLLIKRLYMLLAVAPYLISTHHMVADVLTKCVDKHVFYRMRDYMLNSRSEHESLASRITSFAANVLKR